MHRMTQLTRRLVFTLLVPALYPALLAWPAFAGDSGTPEEAKAMAVRAAELLKSEGPEKAFAEFNTGAEFHAGQSHFDFRTARAAS